MFYIGTTRFNNLTYNENLNYRKTNNENVIYGTNIRTNKLYPPNSLIFVIEMNNETNRIEGIGLIRNTLICDKRYKIYNHNDYNRFVYRGNYWIDREEIKKYDKEITDIFDIILFKGKTHLKRQSGISVLTNTLLGYWKTDLNFLKCKLKNLFVDIFKNTFTNDYDLQENSNTNNNDNDDNELFEIILIKRKQIKINKIIII